MCVAASAEVKRKNAQGVLEPTRAQNIGKINFVTFVKLTFFHWYI